MDHLRAERASVKSAGNRSIGRVINADHFIAHVTHRSTNSNFHAIFKSLASVQHVQSMPGIQVWRV
jgi:hypothetical protein